MTDAALLIAAYDRREKAAIAEAEATLGKHGPKGLISIGTDVIHACARAAAEECGVAWEDARDIIGRHIVMVAS